MKKRVILISFLVIVIILTCFLKFQNVNSNLIGAYVDGKYTSDIPGKDEGYVVEKIDCDNGATGKWDYNSWGILTTNMTRKSRCNVYFKKDKIVNNIKANLDTTGKCPTVNSDGTVNVTSPEDENSLLCSALDNYGTSYYFRGNVQNNYVKFAGFYWRIVRINGDNSIRLIYDGTTAHQNGEASEDRIIGYSAFNEKNDDNAYVGYMYGTPGSSTYEATHVNTNSSTLKNYIDNWYENNLKGTLNEQYLDDNIFCNDISIRQEENQRNTKLGYGKNNTIYTWYFEYFNQNVQNISLKCGSNLFTKSSKIGNSALKYAIANISIPEVILAGGFNSSNTNYYINVGVTFFSMTPAYFYSNVARVNYVNVDGKASYDNYVYFKYGVRPVINLKPNSLKSGEGTMDNPYTVS